MYKPDIEHSVHSSIEDSVSRVSSATLMVTALVAMRCQVKVANVLESGLGEHRLKAESARLPKSGSVESQSPLTV